MPASQEVFHILRPREYPRRLSIVVPMYNEEAVAPQLRAEVTSFLREITAECEVILVNDGSTDATLLKIAEWAKADTRIKVLQLSRNFGHQLAATAGLDYATGDAI